MKLITELNEILFPVEKVELSTIAPGFIGQGENQYAIVATIGEEKRVLNVCSDRYSLIPNADIFPAIEAKLNESGHKFERRITHMDFEKFYVDYVFTDQQLAIGNGRTLNGKPDLIYPKLQITHSYNGKLNYRVSFGWFRLICSNGLTIVAEGKEEESFFVKGKHTPTIGESYKTLVQYIDKFLNKYVVIGKRFEVLGDKMVKDPAERILEVIGAIGGRLPKKTLEPAMEIVAREMREFKTVANDWIIYNAINESLFNDDLNKIHNEFRAELDEKVLNFLIAN